VSPYFSPAIRNYTLFRLIGEPEKYGFYHRKKMIRVEILLKSFVDFAKVKPKLSILLMGKPAHPKVQPSCYTLSLCHSKG
jgi:hypothetical protein